MLAIPKRFLEQLAESDTDSRRYVVRLKESLEHELRRGKLRTERGEESHLGDRLSLALSSVVRRSPVSPKITERQAERVDELGMAKHALLQLRW